MSDTFFDRLHAATPRIHVTWGLISLNTAVWLATIAGGVDPLAPDAASLLPVGGNFAPYTAEQPWRLLSAAVVHAGLFHLLVNMWVLLELGKIAERFYGSAQFALIYMLSAVTGSLASLYFTAQHAVSVGASGAVYGVAGAILAAVTLRRRQIPNRVSRHLRLPLLLFVLGSMLFGLWTSWIDNAAHTGGLGCGLLFGAIMVFRFDTGRFQRLGVPRALLAVLLVVTVGTLMWLMAPLPTT